MKKIFLIFLSSMLLTSCTSAEDQDQTDKAFALYYNSRYEKQDSKELSKYFTDNVIQEINSQYLPRLPGREEGTELIKWEPSEPEGYMIKDRVILSDNSMYIDISLMSNPIYTYRYTLSFDNSNKIKSITKSFINEGGTVSVD